MSAKTLLIATVALAATAVTALPTIAAPGQPGQPAQPGQPGQSDTAGRMPLRATIMFNLLDRNGDGSIDKDELNTVRDAIFAAIDANNDGKLSKDEVETIGPMLGGPHRGGPDNARMGRNDDRDGWRGQGRMDGPRRGPGQGQYDDHRGPRDGMMGRMGFNGPNQDGQGPQGQGPQGRGPGQQNFASLDTNGDGVISQDEFAAAPLPFRGLMPR
jgi:hypothetical protein